MYNIYCIAYKITDEMERQKADEKPFWWEHLHPEVREKSMEEIDKMLTDAGVSPEDMAKMDRKEKYLAVSEGCYVIDCQEYEKRLTGTDKTAFLNQNNNTAQVDSGNAGDNSPGSTQSPTIEPLDMSKSTPPSKEDIETPPAFGDTDDDIIKKHASGISDDDLLLDDDNNSPFKGNVNNVPTTGSTQMSASNPVEIRKMAQSIVRETVNKINTKADAVPETISPQAEQDLLKAVIDELQNLR